MYKHNLHKLISLCVNDINILLYSSNFCDVNFLVLPEFHDSDDMSTMYILYSDCMYMNYVFHVTFYVYTCYGGCGIPDHIPCSLFITAKFVEHVQHT